MLAALRQALERLLQAISIAILISLAVVVVAAVVVRKLGTPFPWYDEVAVIQLAWLTYFGAALAALRRAHLGFSGVLMAAAPALRSALFVFSELVVLGFFAVVAWYGTAVLEVMAGEALVSLPWVPLQLTQSVIPIGAVLFITAHLLSLPAAWARLHAGVDVEQEEIEQAIAEARAAADPDAGRVER